MKNNHITAAYLSNLSAKKEQDREALIMADAQALVDEVLEMAEYSAKTFGFTLSNFNRSRISHGKQGEKIVRNIFRKLGFKVYRDKKNRAVMVIEWPKKK